MNHVRRISAAITVALVSGPLAVLVNSHLRAGAQTALPPVHTVPAGPFQSSAFDAPTAPAHMTQAQVTTALGKVVDLRGHQVSLQYTGWTAPGLYHRAPQSTPRATGAANHPHVLPYGHRNVWRVTIDLTSMDPGGPAVCPPGATADTCPGMRVFHHMVYIIDDASGQVVMASPY